MSVAGGAAVGAAALADTVGTPACGYDTIIVPGPVHPLYGPAGIELKDMNDQGVAVGWYNALSPLPCLWTEAGGFKAIPIPANVVEVMAGDINSNGWILASGLTAQGSRGFVLIPQSDGYEWIEIIPASPVDSGVLAINDKNQVVGYQSMGSPGDAAHPHGGFFWSLETGKVDIVFEGWESCRCTGINDVGVICGIVSMQEQAEFAASSRAFVLVGGKLTVIEPTPPYTFTGTRAVNNSSIVGGTQQKYGGQWEAQAFLFDATNGEIEMLARPPGYTQWGLGDLNDSGLALGTARVTTSVGPLQPALAWTGGGTVLLADLVSPEVAATLTLGVNGLSNDGTVLTPTTILWKTMVHRPMESGGDLDCDGVVGPGDLAMLLGEWGSCESTADLDNDGTVGGTDLGTLLSVWSVP